MKTVVGLFKNTGDAQTTLARFASLGLSPSQMGVLSSSGDASTGARSFDLPELGRVSVNGLMLKFFDEPAMQGSQRGVADALLRMGVSKEDAARCVAGLKKGGVLEAVVVEDSREADAVAIMEGRTTRRTGASGARSTAAPARRTGPTEDVVIPVVREELRIGKQAIDAGGVRVTTHVPARPVEKTVTIREERVNIERRIVDRPIEDYDEVFRDRQLELKAMSEEPLIAKRAHVVEEIRVHKDTTERVEHVHDTLRHTDVELSELPSEHGGQTRSLGPAYEFGRQIRARMPGRTWLELEGQARARWEETNPGTWDRYGDAVRAGWETDE